MKIGIDARLSGLQHAGIGRYTENLITQVLSLNTDDAWVFFFFDQNQAQQVLGDYSRDSRVQVVLTPVRHYSFAEQLRMPSFFMDQYLDLLHVPHFNVPLNYSRPFVVTIHDLLWHERKGHSVTTLAPWKYWIKYGFYRAITRHAILSAQKIFVPAETTKKTVIKYFPNTTEKIIVTKEGSDTRLRSLSTQQAQRILKNFQIDISGPYLLYVGSLYPHKNIDVVLQSLHHLPEYKLYLVGSRNIFSENTQRKTTKLGVSKQVTFLGHVTDEVLSALYNQTFALIQPSLSEGFGLTGVEALTLGTPVIASDIAIFREIYGSAAYFFDPYSSESFIEEVRKVEKNKRGTSQLPNISEYSWKEMAKQTYAEYQRVFKLKP